MITPSEMLLTETHLINEEAYYKGSTFFHPALHVTIHSHKILSIVQLHFRKENKSKKGYHSKSSQYSRKSEPCSFCLTS